MSPVRRLAAVLAPDVVDYSRLMGMDEVATLQAHRREVVDQRLPRSRAYYWHQIQR
jgi:hypothetical protein